MEIRSLGKTSFDTLFKAFGQAFADYEVQVDAEELKAMWRRRGFCPDLSFAAFEGEEIVAFTLNGVGNFNGVKMAYDTGTGTLKAYRGRGLATKVFEHSIPYLKAANINHYLLEVLQHNHKAVSVYRNIGFEVSREFNYFVWNNDDVDYVVKDTGSFCSIEQIDIEKHHSVSDFWDFYPSWQNSFESIQRASGDFVGLGAFVDKRLVGCCVFAPASGDITQIAVNKPFRRKRIASLLLREAIKLNQITKTKLLNTDVSCHSIVDFLKAKNIEISGKQFEMLKKL